MRVRVLIGGIVCGLIAVIAFAVIAQGKGPGYCKHHACPSPPPPPPTDTDGDGVPDSSDQCPTQAGPAPTGCPTNTGTVPNGIPGTWTLRFDDEFNASALDTTKWQPGWFGTGITNPVNGLENNCYDSNNVAEGGGALTERLTMQITTCPNGTTPSYQGAIIHSDPAVGIPGFQFQYGVAEARMYLPDTSTGQVSDWPAWWLANEYNGTYPEIDIAEAGGNGSTVGTESYHVHMATGNPGGDVSGNWTGWHTFAVNWQPGDVRWYYDGRQVAEVTNPVPSSPLFLIINETIGSSCCGGPHVAPSSIQVDYVRVWQ